MNMIAFMATIILIATLVTLVFAFASYFVTKARRNKKNMQKKVDNDDSAVKRTYFERYVPGGILTKSTKSALLTVNDTDQWT